MRSTLGVLAVCCSACGALSLPAGIDAGHSALDAAIIADSGVSATDGGTRMVDGGGGGLDAGVDAGPRPVDAGPSWQFAYYAFDVDPGISLDIGVAGMATVDGGELWVALANNLVYRAAPGSLTLNQVGSFNTGDDVVDVVTTLTEVLLIREQSIWSCLLPCTAFAQFTEVYRFGGVTSGARGCVSGSKVYVVATTNTITSLVFADRSTSTGFAEINTNLPTSTGVACAIDEAMNVSIVGDDNVVVRAASGAVSTQSIELKQGTTGVSWRHIGTNAVTGSWLTGFPGALAKRIGSSWQHTTPVGVTDAYGFWTIVPLSADELLVGAHPYDATKPSLYLWSGTQFTPVRGITSMTVQRSLVLGPNDVLLGGSPTSGGSYLVVHALRQ